MGLLLLILALGVATCSALLDSVDRKPSGTPAVERAGSGP